MLRKTLEFIASLTAIILSFLIAYGLLVDNSVLIYIENKVWEFVFWIGILIGKIVLLVLFLFKGLPLFVEFVISCFRDEDEGYYDLLSPTPVQQSQNVPPVVQLTPPLQESREGQDTIIVTEHTDNGGIFHHVKRGSQEFHRVIANNARRQQLEEHKKITEASDDLLRGSKIYKSIREAKETNFE